MFVTLRPMQPVNARITISEMQCKTKVDMQEKCSKMHGAKKWNMLVRKGESNVGMCTMGVRSDSGWTIMRISESVCYQPVGTAKANIFVLSGCTACVISVTPKEGEGSTPRIFALDSGPPNGVAGEPEDVGDAEFEKEGEGVSGVEGSCHTFVGVPGLTDDFVGVGEPFDPKPGTGLVVLDFSSKGVLDCDAAARRARLDTRTVG